MWIIFPLLILILGAGVFFWHRISVHMLRRIGSPTYSVLRNGRGYEIRRYESFAAAGVEADGNIETAINAAFPVLYSFVTPSVEGRRADVFRKGTSHEISFAIRGDFSEPSQAVADPNVFFSVVPARVVAAYSIKWSVFRRSLEESEKLFRGLLLDDGIRPVGDFDLVLYSAPYAPPFLFRAELIVEIEPL